MYTQSLSAYICKLTLTHCLIIGSLGGAASSSASAIQRSVPTHEMQYSASHDVLLQLSLNHSPKLTMKKIVQKMIVENHDGGHIYHRLRYLLSRECVRAQEMSPEIKNKLLCWMLQTQRCDRATVRLLLEHGANPYATLKSTKGESHPIMSFSASKALTTKQCLGDVMKFQTILEGHYIPLRQSPAYTAIMQEKVRQQIVMFFEEKGIESFASHIDQWRKIAVLLGVKPSIRKIVYPLLRYHITPDFQNAFAKFQNMHSFEKFALACEIYYFVFCIAYNLKYTHQAYDLDHYNFFYKVCLQENKEHVSRCREYTSDIYPLMNDNVKRIVDRIKQGLPSE